VPNPIPDPASSPKEGSPLNKSTFAFEINDTVCVPFSPQPKPQLRSLHDKYVTVTLISDLSIELKLGETESNESFEQDEIPSTKKVEIRKFFMASD